MTSLLTLLIIAGVVVYQLRLKSGKRLPWPDRGADREPDQKPGPGPDRVPDRKPGLGPDLVPAARPEPKRRSRSILKANSGLDGLEDRENDWLARQIREEQKAKTRIMSDMLSLKLEHESQHDSINRLIGKRGPGQFRK